MPLVSFDAAPFSENCAVAEGGRARTIRKRMGLRALRAAWVLGPARRVKDSASPRSDLRRRGGNW